MNSAERGDVTYIKPHGAWFHIDLKELWSYRELLYFLTLRDIKIRYKQTAIGILWAVLQPVLTTAIFTVIFSTFARFDTQAVPYPLFALSGLMVWLFVQTSVTMASNSFVGNQNLVTKVYFPRLIMPVAAALAGLLDLLVSLLILIVMMMYFGTVLTWRIVFVPVFLILAIILTLAFGTLFSALNVRFRDVKHALPFILQIWMIASPIFYPATLLSEKWRLALAINPLTGILEGLRASLFGTEPDWRIIGISVLSVAAMTIFSLFVFKNMEDDFADLI